MSTSKVIVYVCDSAVKAQTAKDFLLSNGYPAANITFADQVDTFTYDAVTYASGGNDTQVNQWVVIGTK